MENIKDSDYYELTCDYETDDDKCDGITRKQSNYYS
jgi:hypothetical protein